MGPSEFGSNDTLLSRLVAAMTSPSTITELHEQIFTYGIKYNRSHALPFLAYKVNLQRTLGQPIQLPPPHFVRNRLQIAVL